MLEVIKQAKTLERTACKMFKIFAPAAPANVRQRTRIIAFSKGDVSHSAGILVLQH
jgi:hypothetical protein